MNQSFQHSTRLALLAIGLLGFISVASSTVQAYPNAGYGSQCALNAYGRCNGQPYGAVQQINYPYAQVNTPAPMYRTDLDPVEQHAQWMNNQRRYQEVNRVYSRTPNNVGGYYTQPSAAIRPYPSYAEYAYRQARAEKQQWGTSATPVYSMQLSGSTKIINTDAFRYPRLYITPQQAASYDRLYELGVTDRRRPENAVVGRRPMPYADSRFGR